MSFIGTQRQLFDVPDGVAYFNTAYGSPQLRETRARLVDAAAAKCHPWERQPPDFFADAERLRAIAARLFGGDADGWAIVPAASYGIGSAARALEPTLRRGDRIVVLDDEFPSNVYPWRRVARETGAVVATAPAPRDGDWTSAALATIEGGARVVAMSQCHWTNASRVDLVAVAAACSAIGATLVVDATQSLGAMPLDLAGVKPGFLVAAGYKWLLAPYGVGLMYVAPEWRDARALEEGWLARANAEDFTSLASYGDDYRPGARRFDVGETCTALLPGAIAALEQLEAWRVAAIADALGAINARIQARLEALGFVLAPAAQRCPHMFAARLPARATGDFVGALRARSVFVSRRGASIRFAPHLHVTDDDVEQLLDAAESAL